VSTLQWLQLVMAATFVVAGLIAWRCRPGNRIGPIMAIYGSMVLAGYFLQKAHAPALMLRNLRSPTTRVGVRRVAVVPSPSRPF